MSHLKVITTEAEYSAAIKRFETLLGAKPGQPGYDERDVLAVLIERYEEERYAIPDADPVDVLRFLLRQNGLAQRDIAAELGSESTVSLVLAGKRRLNRDHIARLSQRFHVSPAVFFANT